MSSHSLQCRKRAAGAAIVIAAVVIAAAPAAGVANATGASAAATPRVCSKAKITPAMVRKVFGSKARIGGKGVSEHGRCAIEAGEHGKAPTGCELPGNTCTNTDVFVYAKHDYKQERANDIYELNYYGHARTTKVHGAGAGAVLLTSSKGYGGTTNPLVLFKAGKHAITIEGPFAGKGEPNKVYKQWERFARAIYARLD